MLPRMAHNLVPITREYLKAFYEKYPLEVLPRPDIEDHVARIEALTAALAVPGSKVPDMVGMPTPTRIDDCFWRNRMICEELALSFQRLSEEVGKGTGVHDVAERCQRTLLAAEKSVLGVQEQNTASVKKQMQKYMPQDFRGALMERTRWVFEHVTGNLLCKPVKTCHA